MISTMSPLSWVAIAVMVLAVAAAASKKFSATLALVVANVVVFVLTLLAPDVQRDLWFSVPQMLAYDPQAGVQAFSSMFVHDTSNLFHILGNMIFLWAFGMPFEERIGPRRFLFIYLVSGLVGTAAQAFASIAAGETNAVLLGASGAIFGVMGAFAAKYPNVVIPLPVPLFFFVFFVRLRVLIGVVIWIAFDLLTSMRQDGVGHYAHLAGGLAGALLAVVALRHITQTPGRNGPIAIDLGALGDFARDGPTKDVLAHMRQNHDEPEVFQAWLDKFFRSATCPTCNHRVMPRHRGEVVCTQGHSFDVRQDRTQKLAPAA